MSKPLTPAERAAWDAIGHAQEHWGAVKKALAAVLNDPVRPPRSTETHERVASDVPTPQAVEAATEWLLDDQAERAGHLISIVRPLIYREAATRLRALADGMEVVPAGITLAAADRLDLAADAMVAGVDREEPTT